MSLAHFIAELQAAMGQSAVSRDPVDLARCGSDFAGRRGRAACVVQPTCTAEISRVMRLAVRHRISLVPQGGNSGLNGAGIPDGSGRQVVLSFDRFARNIVVDADNSSVTVDAGVRLSRLNAEAKEHGLFFPIDVSSDPSVGGMIATNTGGARLIRYGDVRRNLLGLEVVLADPEATIVDCLKGLRKDSSGLDVKQLFVGTGGAFGVVTRAVLALRPLPADAVTILVIPCDHDRLPKIVRRFEAEFGEMLSAFEGMSRNALAAALRHTSHLRNPFPAAGLPDYAALVEISATGRQMARILRAAAEELLESSHREGDVVDALFDESDRFWAIRDAIPDSVKAEGTLMPLDISMPRSRLPHFRAETLAFLDKNHPEIAVYDFGHFADGGDHFVLCVPPASRARYPFARMVELRTAIYDRVVGLYGGSFSAEHGIGPYNQAYYDRYSSAPVRDIGGRLQDLLNPERLVGRVRFGGAVTTSGVPMAAIAEARWQGPSRGVEESAISGDGRSP